MGNTVLHNQTILDVSIQTTGSVENCFQIAIANGKSVSDELSTGMSILEATEPKIDEDILSYFKAKKIHPATGINSGLDVPELGGIGYMRIGATFKIK